VLLDGKVPDSPVNRRISIIVMNKRTEEAIQHENGTLLSAQPDSMETPVAAGGGGEAGPVVGEPVAALTAP
jgi:chemotaxis protein MotB